MGRATVRAAIAAWLTPASIAGLTTVYPSRPKQIPAQDFGLGTGGGSGAVLVVHLAADDETRIAVGGPTSGKKTVTHKAALEVLFQSVKPDAVAAMADHDTLIDNLMARIRADRTFGTAGNPIWQAGEGPEGIRLELTEPVLGAQNVIVNAVARFDVVEQITS